MDALSLRFSDALSLAEPACFGVWDYLCIMADRERFLDLLQPHRTALVQYVRAITQNMEDVRDIVGETILAALERIEDVDKEESFRFFLFKIAQRKSWRMIVRKRFFIPLEKKHEEISYDGEALAQISHDVDLLHKSLHQLPFKTREAISLFEFGGFSLEEIQSLQGGSLSGVKSRISRGRLKLKILLSDSLTLTGSQDPAGSTRTEGDN
jgi:RNA polymerase sigma-70 factor, ECF subfamily